jgi:hypothetical protein
MKLRRGSLSFTEGIDSVGVARDEGGRTEISSQWKRTDDWNSRAELRSPVDRQIWRR